MTLYTSISHDLETLIERCVDVLDTLCTQALARDGRFVVSLAGGNTPAGVYEVWARTSRLDWSKAVLIFGDERCVPPEHADSNYRMVKQSLLDHLPAKPLVLRMEGESETPTRAAVNYQRRIQAELAGPGNIHVAILGVGEDGHTASLFPGAEVLHATGTLCEDTWNADHTQQRLTLTVPALRAARKRMFIVTGAGKARILASLLQGPLHPDGLPAQFFLRDEPLNTNLMLDAAAAKFLQQRD